MEAQKTFADQVMKVWEWCFEAYIRHGIKLQFPANTDPVKTYQWRYARAIALKFDEWDFDEETARQFIDVAVAHAKEIGLLRKGLASLHQTNVLNICYDKLQRQSDSNRHAIDSLRYIHDWLSQRIGRDHAVEVLLRRTDVGQFCNMVKWVRASRISPLYLSLSRSCGRALVELANSHPQERNLLPKPTTLYMLRSEFLEDVGNVKRAKLIFGPDWRKSCQ